MTYQDKPMQLWEKTFVSLMLNGSLLFSIAVVLVALVQVAIYGGMAWIYLCLSVLVLWIIIQLRPRRDGVRLWVDSVIDRWL